MCCQWSLYFSSFDKVYQRRLFLLKKHLHSLTFNQALFLVLNKYQLSLTHIVQVKKTEAQRRGGIGGGMELRLPDYIIPGHWYL